MKTRSRPASAASTDQALAAPLCWAMAPRHSRKAGSFGSCGIASRSEEHTSELQSHSDLVCRLLLEKKKNKTDNAEQTPDALAEHTPAHERPEERAHPACGPQQPDRHLPSSVVLMREHRHQEATPDH